MPHTTIVTKWVNFFPQTTNGKTQLIEVHSQSNNPITLGIIRWFGAVRMYVFYPVENVFFTPDTLNEIAAKIVTLMDQRAAEKEGV